MDKRFYRFLQATCCNWRNSFFIDCQRCDGCSGFLLSVNHNAVPSIIPVAVFEELSGETVDKYDCVGIMTLEGFQRFYTSWLVWTRNGAVYPNCGRSANNERTQAERRR